MSNQIKLDLSKTKPFIGEHEVEMLSEQVKLAHQMLHQKTGPGNDFLGWVDLPVKYDKQEFQEVLKAADRIRKDSQVLVVIGIGGSYLGARAAIDLLNHTFYNQLSDQQRKNPQILYLGNTISPNIKSADFSVDFIFGQYH